MTELFIVVDTSGSMYEMGKVHIQRNLCRYISQLKLIDQEKYSSLKIHFYQWARNFSEFSLKSNEDTPNLVQGSSNLCLLSDFLSQHSSDTGKLMALILSDGNFPNSDIVDFKSHLGTLTGLIIRTVAVGADADFLKLRKISTNNTVYLSENIASAIDSTIFGSDEPVTAPVSTDQILQSALPETEEYEEDWDV